MFSLYLLSAVAGVSAFPTLNLHHNFLRQTNSTDTSSSTSILDCSGQPYYQDKYTCFGSLLCPILSGVAYQPCGPACYDPAEYGCTTESVLYQVATATGMAASGTGMAVSPTTLDTSAAVVTATGAVPVNTASDVVATTAATVSEPEVTAIETSAEEATATPTPTEESSAAATTEEASTEASGTGAEAPEESVASETGLQQIGA